jgi:pimeloyl-ACP methyl ester carboxylesterase
VTLEFTPLHRGGSGTPLVCVHGFLDTWRTWELTLPALERRHEVIAPTLAGHAGGPPVGEHVGADEVLEAVERAMDDAGFETAHIAGNSLGGYIALRLAQRGRARSVVAFSPAGGWSHSDESFRAVLAQQESLLDLLRVAGPLAGAIARTKVGRRRATQMITVNYEHLPTALVEHLIVGAARCDGARPLLEIALRDGWPLDAERITCPVRFVWGAEDRVLTWPGAAARFRDELPHADWVLVDGAGHCPQLDVPLEAAELIVGFTDR